MRRWTGSGLRTVLALCPLATGAAPWRAATAQEVVDPVAVRVRERIESGFPLTAARELAAHLSTSSEEATPELILLAARAQAETRAWGGVTRLLADRTWLDSIAGGEGRLLLAAATAADGRYEEAVIHYARVLGSSSVESADGLAANVGYARALLGAGQPAAAAARFEALAALDSGIDHWLRLSALQAHAVSGAIDRAAAVAVDLHGSDVVWRDSIWTAVALAAFRSGDAVRGLGFADSLSQTARGALAGDWIVPAFLAAGDSVGARREAERAIAARGVGPSAGAQLVGLDSSSATLRRVAGSDAREGRYERAAELLRRAVTDAPEAERADLALERAKAQFGSGDYRAVGRTLGPWLESDGVEATGPARVASQEVLWRMRFLAGRALYRQGSLKEAAGAWASVAATPAAPDGAWASFLIAEIAHDRGELDRARAAYERTVRDHPRSPWTGRALIRLGMLALLREASEEAVEWFDAYRRRFPGGDWSHAATYWAARARDAHGDSAGARVLYRQALGVDPLSYYGVLAGRALGVEPWDFLTVRATPPATAGEGREGLIERMNLLRSLGWKGRALRELAARDRRGETWTAQLAFALALNEAGWSWQGTGLAWGVLRARSGLWSEDLLKAAYPLVYRPVVEAAAQGERLDPALLAALVRRESQFDRDVISSAAAVGLTQVLPRTGAEVARQLGVPDFDPAQLVVPEVNLTLGARYLRQMLDRHDGSLVAALISYNAGPHRYARWRNYPEFSADAELMIERIPFTETRLYVKNLITYRYIYSRLYGLGSRRPATGP